jgi:hypothetical protein
MFSTYRHKNQREAQYIADRDAYEWSPSVLAGRCVKALCVREPEMVIPVLGEFIERNCQSEDLQLRETSLRCLRAVFGATG